MMKDKLFDEFRKMVSWGAAEHKLHFSLSVTFF